MAFTFAMLLHSVVLLLLLVLLLLILLLAMLIHVVCSTDNVMLVETYQFNDSANDVFQREPYCVRFRLNESGFVFLLYFLHTSWKNQSGVASVTEVSRTEILCNVDS